MQKRRRLNIKPNFLGIGSAKAGTTQMAYLLRQHPEIFIPKNKELHYFDNDDYIGINSFRDYLAQFQYNLAIGEFTPSYLFMPEAPQQIFEQLGKDMNFIVALRNPVDRAFSHYCHAVNNWSDKKYRKLNYPVETLTFSGAIKNEEERLNEGLYHVRHLSYFSKGLYADQLKKYFNFFPQKNFYIYTLEDFSENPEKILFEICMFLNVCTDVKFKDVKKKKNSQTNRTLTSEIRSWLNGKYQNSIQDLELLLNRSFAHWR